MVYSHLCDKLAVDKAIYEKRGGLPEVEAETKLRSTHG